MQQAGLAKFPCTGTMLETQQNKRISAVGNFFVKRLFFPLAGLGVRP